MQTSLSEKITYQSELLTAWTIRTIRARYQQSLLGVLWAVFQPIATVVILTFVFSFVVRIDTGDIPYIVFSYTAMVPWFLLSSSLTDMVESIVVNMNLVAKIYFPREILVIAAMLARLVDFSISFFILILMMLLYGLPILQLSWIYLPVLILIQLTLALGLGFLGAALNAFFRDIRHIFTLGIQLWFYATPIIYPVTLVPPQFRTIYYLNPMTPVIEGYRSVLLNGTPPVANLWLSALTAVIILILGYLFFKRVEPRFADIV